MQITQLTFTRFVAAFLIVIFHYGLHTFPFNYPLVFDLAVRGYLSVSYFFFLSGFILAVVYAARVPGDAQSKKKFWIARFARIYPVYFLGFISTLLLLFLAYDAYPAGNGIIMQFLCMHAWAPGLARGINYPSWSISVEMLFYTAFPFLLAWLVRKRSAFLIVSALVWLCSIFVFIYLKDVYLLTHKGQAAEDLASVFPLLYLNVFMLGMCGGYYYQAGIAVIRNPVLAATCFVLALLLLAVFCFPGIFPGLIRYADNGLLAPVFFLLLISLANDQTVFARIFSWKPFVFLGDISYGMYILQCPVFMIVEKCWPFMDGFFPGKFWFGSLLLILSSALSYVFS